MSDEVKTKKVDVRLTESLHEDLTLVAWVCGLKKSELLRAMIDFFIEQGKIRCDDQQLGWEDVLQLAKQRQLQGNLTFEEVQKGFSGRTARPTESDLSEELQDELKIFAEIYAKSALEAFKNHKKGERNGG